MQTSTIEFSVINNSDLVAIFGNFSPYSREYAYLYDNLANKFLIWFLPLIISIGLVGTAFCLAFLFMSKLFPKSLLLWLVSICVGDFMILSWDGVWMTLKVWWKFDIRDQGDAICKAHSYISNYFLYWSAYMQACMSLQRLYLIVRPLQARTELPFRRLFIAWLVCSLVLTLPHLIYFYWTVEVRNDCDPPDPSFFYTTSLCDLIIWGLIPMLSMILSTGVISWKVIRFQTNFSGKKRETPPTSSSTSQSISSRFRAFSRADIHRHQPPPSNTLSPPTMHSGANPSNSPMTSSGTCGEANCGRRHGGSDNARHVTKLLITMNMWYMVTTFPYLIYLIHLNFVLHNNIEKDIHRFLFYFLRSLCYLNSCSNWFFYCAAGRVFRKRAKRILLRLLCCSQRITRNSEMPSAMAPAHRRDTTVITPPMRMVIRMDKSRSFNQQDFNKHLMHDQAPCDDLKRFLSSNNEVAM